MNAADLIRRLHFHRSWTTSQVLDTVRPLTWEQLNRSFEIGQGSVWKTLTHLWAAEYVWLEALRGHETSTAPGDDPSSLPGNQDGEDPLRSLAELEAAWETLETEWKVYLNGLADTSLEESVYKVSTSSKAGQRIGVARFDVLMHVCTHAQYTVAQLVNMLRQLGVTEFPPVMLISLARSESLSAS